MALLARDPRRAPGQALRCSSWKAVRNARRYLRTARRARSNGPAWRSQIRPFPQQIVIEAGEANDRSIVANLSRERLDRTVELKQHLALIAAAHHALHPEEASQPTAARDRLDPMHASRGVEDEITGRGVGARLAVGVVDDEDAAVMIGRVGQEKSCRQVGADAVRGAADLAHGIVDMGAKR